MVKHLHLKGFVALATAFATSFGAFAATPIHDAAGLAAISNDLAGEYELAADIQLTGEWTSIGTSLAPFEGVFDGKGHTITGLTQTAYEGFMGLFGASTGTIKNVRIEGANISNGNDHVGIAVGRVLGGGVIDNVFTSGYVYGRDHVGGVAGDAGETDQSATVTNCLSTAYVYATQYQAGGIVGWTKGNVTVTNNMFIGEAYVGAYGSCAGIVAFVEDGTTTVKNNVNAARKLTGMMEGRNTYGIVGNTYNENSTLVSEDNLTSEATLIYNRDDQSEAVDQSAFPVDFNGFITSVADLKKASTYTDLGFGSAWNLNTGNYPVNAGMSLPIAGDYIHTATIPAEVFVDNVLSLAPISTYGREVSISSNDETVASVDGTDVTFKKAGTVTVTLTTEGDDYCAGYTLTLVFNPTAFDATIATAADIAKLKENPQGSFVLTADIDMAEVEDFAPISLFSGSIDGQGHFIRNLTFNNPDTDKAAFIAEFNGTFIKNLGFDNANITGNADVAAVVGALTSDGVISNVVVCNSYIAGRDHVASILGKLDGGGRVENCLANAVIYTRSYQAAGIVGVGIKGTVDKCVFSGTVSAAGNTNLAGIVSLLDADNVAISNCLAAGVSYDKANTGDNYGLIVNQHARQCALENNYVTNYSLVNGVEPATAAADSKNGAAVSMEDVRGKDFYTSTLGFDFDNTWKFIEGGEGYMLPVLSWMNGPLASQVFNIPSVDGLLITYVEGNEFWNYNVMMGAWGQSVAVKQLSGEDEGYASIEESEGRIYAGNSDGELPSGPGEAEFEVGFIPAELFTVSGRNTFEVIVSESGAEKVISTVEDFLNIRKNPSAVYTLAADIDLAGVEFNGFCNDGNTSFTGTLDGAGHTVKNFNIESTGNDQGLFGKTSGATIKNIAFVNFTIKANNHVGIIGQGSAYIENVAIVGQVSGNDHVGLVAGDADGIEITNSYAVGAATAGSQLGGFFGCTLEGGCKITNCLSNVSLSATFRGWTGGFVGLIDKAESAVTIENSVSIGNCSTQGSGTPKVTTPFIGGNGAGKTPNAVITFKNNIYNSTATMDGENTSTNGWPSVNETAEGGVVESATAQNPAVLSTQNPYNNINWDFENVWAMGTGDYKYPVLKGVSVNDVALSGVEDVVAAPEASVSVVAANGEITVAGLSEASVITVYNAAGVQVAAVSVNAPEAVVAAPAAGLYIVAVATDGAVTTAKVVVK